MFFKYKLVEFSHGDCRVVRKFAFFPRVLQDGQYNDIGVIWLGRYDLVQLFYSKEWRNEYRVLFGMGRTMAEYKSKLYGGRLIE